MKKLFILFLFLLIPFQIQAIEDCPLGRADDVYPGDCGLYHDADHDAVCDYSQSDEKDSSSCGIPENVTVESNSIPEGRVYHVLPISALVIVLYFLTHLLSKRKIITVLTHRRIWNVALLISFLISGIFGILLTIQINFNIKISLPFNMLFWHVEAGVAMFIITTFHIWQHSYYFKAIFKK